MFKQMRLVKKKLQGLSRNILDSIFYRVTKNQSVIKNPRKIVFVCTGNICRSAFAEELLKTEIAGAFPVVESCGLDVQVVSPSPVEAVLVAEKIGLDLSHHRSRDIGNCDLESADLILAMEYWQFRELAESFPHKRPQLKLLREFAPFPENLLCNIDDPFGQNERVFQKCFAQIQRSVATIKALI